MTIVTETLDAPDNATTPYALAVGDMFVGQMPPGSGDTGDWVSFDVTLGETLLVVLSTRHHDHMPLALYDGQGQELARDAPGVRHGYSPAIEWTATFSGQVFAAIEPRFYAVSPYILYRFGEAESLPVGAKIDPKTPTHVRFDWDGSPETQITLLPDLNADAPRLVYLGDGHDALRYELFPGRGSDLGLHSGDTIHGGAGDDTINARLPYAILNDLEPNGFRSTWPAVNIFGGSGNDRLSGGHEDDLLSGDGGNDWLWGGLDDDTLFGGKGRDTLFGGDRNDTLYGGHGNDRLSGGASNDRLYGEWGDDWLTGGDGFDQLFGGKGHDTLLGGEHYDWLYGGEGDDLLVGGSGSDSLFGGSGVDTASYRSASGGIVLTGGREVQSAGGADVLSSIEVVEGSLFDDQMQGNAYDTFLLGLAGHDTLKGGDGDDLLHGGWGRDSLFGGRGDDKLQGQGGRDTLTGGAGADRFIFTPGSGRDTITDFTQGEDQLRLKADLWRGAFDQAALEAQADLVSGAVVLQLKGAQITLQGVTSTAGLLEDIVLT